MQEKLKWVPPNLLESCKMATLCGLVGASGPNELQRIIVCQPRLLLYSTQVSAALRFSCMRPAVVVPTSNFNYDNSVQHCFLAHSVEEGHRPKADDMAGSAYVAEDYIHKNPEPRVGLLRALRE